MTRLLNGRYANASPEERAILIRLWTDHPETIDMTDEQLGAELKRIEAEYAQTSQDLESLENIFKLKTMYPHSKTPAEALRMYMADHPSIKPPSPITAKKGHRCWCPFCFHGAIVPPLASRCRESSW